MSRAHRDKWLAEGLQIMASDGIGAVSVDLLVARLAVSKASFHWHFGDRAAFLKALVEYWRERALDGDGHQLFAADPRVDRAMRAWAVGDPEVAAAVRAVDDGRLSRLTEIHRAHSAEPERVARLEYAVFVGATWLIDDLGSPEGRALAADLEAMLAAWRVSSAGSAPRT